MMHPYYTTGRKENAMEEKNIAPGVVGTVTLSAESFRDLIRSEAEANARAKLAEEKYSAELSRAYSLDAENKALLQTVHAMSEDIRAIKEKMDGLGRV